MTTCGDHGLECSGMYLVSSYGTAKDRHPEAALLRGISGRRHARLPCPRSLRAKLVRDDGPRVNAAERSATTLRVATGAADWPDNRSRFDRPPDR